MFSTPFNPTTLQIISARPATVLLWRKIPVGLKLILKKYLPCKKVYGRWFPPHPRSITSKNREDYSTCHNIKSSCGWTNHSNIRNIIKWTSDQECAIAQASSENRNKAVPIHKDIVADRTRVPSIPATPVLPGPPRFERPQSQIRLPVRYSTRTLCWNSNRRTSPQTLRLNIPLLFLQFEY